jgi:hypothetical protein
MLQSRFNIEKFYNLLTEYIYGFGVTLRMNSDYFSKQL